MKLIRVKKNAILLTGALTLAGSTLCGQAKPFPEIPGWTLTTDSKVFNPQNLWDFIDGAAELFLSYGFVDLTIGTYRSEDSLEIRVEAYRHSSPAMAFGIYSTERKPDYHFLPIGTQGYQEEDVLNFLSGEYYIKCSTHTPGRRIPAAMRSVAQELAGHMNRPARWPAELGYLPDEGRQGNTEGYVTEGFLGYSFFRNAFTARYGEGDGFLLFVLEFPARAGADDVLTKYRSAVVGSEPVKGGIRFADPNNGPITILVRDSLLFGIVNPPDDAVEAHYLSLIAEPRR